MIDLEELSKNRESLEKTDTLVLAVALREVLDRIEQLCKERDNLKPIAYTVDAELTRRLPQETVILWDESLKAGFGIYCHDPADQWMCVEFVPILDYNECFTQNNSNNNPGIKTVLSVE